MLTVQDLQRDREAKARVNHETYKMLLRQVQDRLRTRAANRGTDLAWQVPPLVPGRPVYAVSHAARYVSDKLRRGGFEVAVASPSADVHVLYVSWRAVALPPASSKKKREPRRVDDDAAVVLTDASRTLEKLKARLRVG